MPVWVGSPELGSPVRARGHMRTQGKGHVRALGGRLGSREFWGDALLWRRRLGRSTGRGTCQSQAGPSSRLRPALGECLARLAAAMPVAFLEPQLNEYNACSVYTTKSPRERASKWCGAGAGVRKRPTQQGPGEGPLWGGSEG